VGGSAGDDPELYTVRADGTGITRLTNDAGDDGGPAWAPYGSRLAFNSAHGDDYDIEIVRAADHARSTLAQSKRYEGQFAWSRDGQRLAFISDRDGADAMYVIDADGTRLQRLTAGAALNPAWSK
jgi:TolB protein